MIGPIGPIRRIGPMGGSVHGPRACAYLGRIPPPLNRHNGRALQRPLTPGPFPPARPKPLQRGEGPQGEACDELSRAETRPPRKERPLRSTLSPVPARCSLSPRERVRVRGLCIVRFMVHLRVHTSPASLCSGLIMRCPIGSRSRILRRLAAVGCLLLALAGDASSPLLGAFLVSPGIQILPGFRILPFAGPELADDIRSMTVDAEGRVVVSGPGYVRLLLDPNGDGMADSAMDMVRPPAGAAGLEMLGGDLLLMGGTGLQRYADTDGDGIPDSFSAVWLAMATGEWGGRAVHLGPDGWAYASAGHAAGLAARLTGLIESPIAEVEGGAIVRLATRGSRTEVLADGFYDIRDLAFSAEGDVLAWENGREPAVPLPGSRRPRLVMVETGGHHGWRHLGDDSGTFRAEDDPQAIPALASLPHGLVSAVLCYRHYQFPEDLRQGLFVADWAGGHVFHVTLEPEGAAYRTRIRPFLESLPGSGFAPSALAVARDGSLLVATGGRKARGGVFMVQYVAEPEYLLNATNWSAFAVSDRVLAMESPQPDASWSRRLWIPVAQNIGAAAFEEVVMDANQDPLRRVRAIEVLVEVFNGLSAQAAGVAVAQGPPPVRARVAWALGRHPLPDDIPMLGALAGDASPYVRHHALSVVADRARALPLPFVQQVIALNLAAPDRRVQLQCARLASKLPDPAWEALWQRRLASAWPARVTLLLARLERSDAFDPDTVAEGLALLAAATSAEQRFIALRLAQAGLGVRHLARDGVPVLPAGVEVPADLRTRIEEAALKSAAMPDDRVSREAVRLLGMVRAGRDGLSAQVASRLPRQSTNEALFDLLGVLATLEDGSLTNATAAVAAALLKVGYMNQADPPASSRRWVEALLPVVRSLVSRDPRLGAALVAHPRFGQPEHVRLVPLLGSEHFIAAARRILDAASRPGYRWGPETVDAVAGLAEPARLDVLRGQWNQVILRDAVVLALAHEPVESDRPFYLWCLNSDPDQVVEAALMALGRLPRDTDGRRLVPLIQLVERLQREARRTALLPRALDLLARQTGLPLDQREPDAAMRQALDWFGQLHPELLRELDGPATPHRVTWASRMNSARWERGNPRHGAELFQQLGCAYCHEGSREMGAYLGGYASSRSPEEVLEAVAYPDRECDPHDRTTVVLMKDGTRHEGVVIHESAEVLIVQTGAAATVRLAVRDVAQQFRSRHSVMPAGLVNDLRPADLADLYAYLQSLPPPATSAPLR